MRSLSSLASQEHLLYLSIFPAFLFTWLIMSGSLSSWQESHSNLPQDIFASGLGLEWTLWQREESLLGLLVKRWRTFTNIAGWARGIFKGIFFIEHVKRPKSRSCGKHLWCHHWQQAKASKPSSQTAWEALFSPGRDWIPEPEQAVWNKPGSSYS